MSTVRNKKWGKTNVLAIITVALLVIVITMIFIVLPFFGMYGLYELLKSFDLVNITFADSFFGNLKYFGFLFLIIYLITLFLDIISKVIFSIKRKKFTRKNMALNYIIQAILGTYIFKALVESNFTRIDVSLLAAFIMFVVIYLIYYATLDDYEVGEE